jgi:signal recognition particle subunit SRP54
MMTKIVRDELAALMGGTATDIKLEGNPAVILIAGLQGSGKTTFSGKLASFIKSKKGRQVLLVAGDVYRPAAIDQLKILGQTVGVEVYTEPGNNNPVLIAENAIKYARQKSFNTVIVDTAGRLAVDEAMMQEITAIKAAVNPSETLFVVDSMTGQDAVNTAKEFNDRLDFDGVVLTKLDGDTRGGAALSIKEMTGIPIKIMSTGEKLDQMEIFYPDRLADRILGMGDVLSLIDTVTENIDEDEMMSMAEKMMSNQFNYNDMLKQFKMIKKMGSMSKILGFLPGMGNMKQALNNVDDKALDKVEAIIYSMTEKERKNPELIERDYKRRERIAKGSGRSIQEVNKLRQSLQQMKASMKQMSKMSESDAKRMQTQMKTGNYQGLAQGQKVKKGKGKGKGSFRF